MKKIVIKFGLIGGAIISVFMASTMPFFDENTDMSQSELMGYAAMVVALSTISIGIRNYRNHELQGVISFGKAFKVGLYIALVASTLYVLTWMVISHFYMPNFMEIYVQNTIDTMLATGKTQDEIDAQLTSMERMMEMYKNPFFKVLITYTEILPVGILISLISAATLKKKERVG
jgi:hypothetical protein